MNKNVSKLIKLDEPLTCSVQRDDFISASERAFDCTFDGTSKFYPWALPQLPPNFNIGVIVGSSGSGKSSLLRQIAHEETISWSNELSILSHFQTPDEAINKMGAVGLNSVPSWYKSYNVLSNGEKFRADLARRLKTGAVIDEFTSVVDRNVAKAASVSLSRYVKNNEVQNLVLATCHRDVLEWLEPDWVIDTDAGEFKQGFFLSDQKLIFRFTEQAVIYGPCLKSITI